MEEKAERKLKFDLSGTSAWEDHSQTRVFCNRRAEFFRCPLGRRCLQRYLSHLIDDFLREMPGCTPGRLQVNGYAA